MKNKRFFFCEGDHSSDRLFNRTFYDEYIEEGDGKKKSDTTDAGDSWTRSTRIIRNGLSKLRRFTSTTR